jgi:cellulose synthase/poly-beta-1,6-N-acetylglucosamine synthase-like glycosyltransferase
MTIMYFVPEIFFYLVFFIGLYFQVFLLVSFFFTSEDEDLTVKQPIHGYEPSVAIIVPCWNEEKTVKKTVYLKKILL